MTRPSKLQGQDWPWLLSLLLIGCMVVGVFGLLIYRRTGHQGGVPLDDAWIHFQFARNLASGAGFSFNPGTPTAGSTSPLWTVLLAGIAWGGGQFPVAGQVLSVLSFLAVLPATYIFAHRLSGLRWAGWLAAAMVALNGRMVWASLSALETPLFALLTLVAIGHHLSDRNAGRYRVSTAALFALAALTRPEGYLLFALAMVDHLIVLASAPRAHCRALPLLPVLAFVVLVFPYLAFSWHTSGHLLPNTYHAKTIVDGRPDLETLSVAAQYLILDNPVMLPFFVVGAGTLVRKARILGFWSVGLPLVYAFLHAPLYQHGRYLIPLIPCNALLGVVGLLEARRWALRRGWRISSFPARVAVPLTLVLLIGTAWRLPTMALLTAENVANINEMHVRIGQWVTENTPPDALLALNDIGAITYISERQVVDLAGLVTPELIPLLLAPDRDDNLAAYMAKRGVDYVVVFPTWFPGLTERRDLLEPLYEVTLDRNTVAGGRQMVVYAVHWRR
jgi:hypothetical protein